MNTSNYICSKCQKKFLNIKNLFTHNYKYINCNKLKYNCNICKYSTNKKTDFYKHIKTDKHRFLNFKD